MNTLKDIKNGLLQRREVKVLVNSDKNPGIQNALKTIAEQFKSHEDTIAIKQVKSKFGRDTFLIDAYIYDSADIKQKIEPKQKAKKSAAGAK